MKVFKLMSMLFIVVSCFFICGCTNNELTSLEVNTDGAKTTFNVGEEFTHSGLVVTAVFADGSKEVVTDFSVNSDAFNSNAAGNYNITVTFSRDGVSQQATYQVTVGAVFDSLVLDTTGAKTIFFEGEEFTSQGLVVKAKYDGKADETITNFEVISSSYNKDVKGRYSITVRASVDGDRRTAYYVVEVVGKLDNVDYLIGLNVSVGTDSDRKVLETVNATYDYSDLEVEAVYLSGTTKTLTSEQYELDITGVDLTKRGSYEAIISYSETYNIANSTETITIEEDNFILVLVENEVTKIEFETGTQEFEFNGFSSDDWKFTVTYADETTAEVAVKDVVVGNVASTSGSHQVEISYTQEQINEVDSITVTCNVDYTIKEATSSTTTYTFDATTIPATGINDGTAIPVDTKYDGYFTIVGVVTQRISSSSGNTTAVDVASALNGAIEFTVTGTANVSVVVSSTGGSNTSPVAMIDSDGTVIANKEEVTTVTGSSSARVTLTYEGLVAGTYRIVSPNVADNRNLRVYSISATQIIGEVTGATYTYNISDATDGSYTTNLELVEGVITVLATADTDCNVSINGNNKIIDGFTFTKRLQLNGTGKPAARNIEIKVNGPAKITIYGMSGSSTATRTLQLYDSSFTAITDQGVALGGAAIQKAEYQIAAAGTYYLASAGSGINIYYISVEVE